MGKLSNKQRIFIDEYLKCWNATEAARRAGYKDNDATLASVGWENLRKPEISKVIDQRLQESEMSAGEAIRRQSEIGRGDLGDFVNDFGMIDISQARIEGKTHLIKKLTTKTVITNGKEEETETHTQTIELYPADAAHDRILRIHGKYKDVGTENNPFIIKGYKSVSPDDWDETGE